MEPALNDGIRRTAESMLEEHGPRALAEAKEQAKIAEKSGMPSLAKSWDQVCATVADLQNLSQGQLEYLATADVPQEVPEFAPKKGMSLKISNFGQSAATILHWHVAAIVNTSLTKLRFHR